MSFHFAPSGVSVEAQGASFSFGLASYGRAGALTRVAPALPRSSGNIVSYTRGPLRELYSNGPVGLEQSFDLSARPAGQGPLSFDLALSGATVRLDGRSVAVLNPSAGGQLRYDGLRVTGGDGRVVPARLALRAGQLSIQVDDVGARYPLHVDPFFTRTAQLLPSGSGTGPGSAGMSVALSADGRTALVGAPNASGAKGTGNSTGAGLGAGMLWVLVNGSWTGPTILQPAVGTSTTGASATAAVGTSVALSSDGSVALLGGPTDGTQGAAWIFKRPSAGWPILPNDPVATAKLVDPNAGMAAQGSSAALSDDGRTALIGGPTYRSDLGAAYVWHTSDGSWSSVSESETLVSPAGCGVITSCVAATGADGTSKFGASVSLAGDGATALVGGPHDSTVHLGAAWVFTLSNAAWSQFGGKLVGSGSSNPSGPGVQEGFSVALSRDGSTALIGGPGNNLNAGGAWVFALSNSSWSQQTPSPLVGNDATGPARQGQSVALSGDGNTALIGGPSDSNSGTGSPLGAAWLFTRAGGAWSQAAPKLNQMGSGLGGGAELGSAVALSGGTASTALIGLPTAGAVTGGFQGQAWVYTDAAPTVSSISPSTGPTTGGTSVTITGTNLTGATGVTFGANTATITATSDTSITATAPAGTAGTTVDVKVTTPGGTSATSAADQFTYGSGPVVTGVSPSSGPGAGGTTVTITGTNLSGATEADFGPANPASITSNTDTQIVATSPSGSGAVDVTVTTAGGTSPATPADQFTYVPMPAVSAVSPTMGRTGGGTSVTITGTDLGGATAVMFGSTPATITSDAATSITATSPAGSAGTVDVTVTTAGGTSATSSADQFTYVPAPIVTGVSPSSGPAAGGTTVTISGANLSGATAVMFGTTPATIVTDGPTSITATSPPGSGGVNVTVTTTGGTSATTKSTKFSYKKH